MTVFLLRAFTAKKKNYTNYNIHSLFLVFHSKRGPGTGCRGWQTRFLFRRPTQRPRTRGWHHPLRGLPTTGWALLQDVFAPRVLKPGLLFVMHLSIGNKVFDTRCTDLQVIAKVAALLHNGHVELGCDHGNVRVVNHSCFISFGIATLEFPPPSPSIPTIDVRLKSLRKFLWTPLGVEAPFAVTPQHDCHLLGNLGTWGIWESHIKSSK